MTPKELVAPTALLLGNGDKFVRARARAVLGSFSALSESRIAGFNKASLKKFNSVGFRSDHGAHHGDLTSPLWPPIAGFLTERCETMDGEDRLRAQRALANLGKESTLRSLEFTSRSSGLSSSWDCKAAAYSATRRRA